MHVHALSEKRAGAHVPARYESLLGLIGDTPLVRLVRVAAELPHDVEVWAKLEYLNPGGSVKDRTARQIVLDALHRGDLGDGQTLLDATSGNTGVAYAMLGAALGIRVKLVMPENAPEARKRLIRAFGAQIEFTSAEAGDDGSVGRAREIIGADESGEYWYADQYSNPSNPRAHELTTATEILAQTQHGVTHFVSSLGTSGTIMGTARGLRAANPAVRVLACQPSDPVHRIEGLRHLESAFRPAIFDEDSLDGIVECDADDARAMAIRLAREEGLAVGDSAGMNVVAALRVARELAAGVVVTVLCDNADRYLSR